MTTFKLEQYINFESLEELNHHVSQHVKNNQLNDTQYKLLTILSQHSCKYLGASYLKVSTLMSLLDVSKSTIKRSLKTLVEKGIIAKKHTFRPVSGGFGANIYVINQYVETTTEPSSVDSCNNSQNTAGERLLEQLEQKETTSSKSKYNNSLVTKSAINREYNLSYKDVVPSNIPTQLGEHMLLFFDSATAYRLYSSMSNALGVYKGREEFGSEHIVDWMHRSIRALVTAIKNHRHNPQKYPAVKNMYSYAYQTALNIAVKDEFEYV